MPYFLKNRVQAGSLGLKLRMSLTAVPWKTTSGKELNDRCQIREERMLVVKEMKVLRGRWIQGISNSFLKHKYLHVSFRTAHVSYKSKGSSKASHLRGIFQYKVLYTTRAQVGIVQRHQ
jgi:hypothetical protein